MKKTVLAFCLLILIATANQCFATQIIVINETQEDIYTLERITLSGDLEKNLLIIQGTGEIIQGENVKVYLFGPASDVLVTDLKINGQETTVSFDDGGYFFIADEGLIKLEGKLIIRTIGQIILHVNGPINKLEFDLEHGYAIDGDRFGVYKNRITLQRSEKVAMLIDGNFRYTYAERNSFNYLIYFKAYGSSLGSYTLDLPNNEIVSSVSGAMKWEQSGNKLLLDLQSNEASISITGLFSTREIRVPLKEDKHHVLIESDPEKKISISTNAREIDLSESSMNSQYSNARAFIASRNNGFSVTVKQLEVLPSLSASVRMATNQIAITEKGSIVGEMNYDYANTGMDYIEIDAPGTPLYASTDRAAVKLTKEEKLFLSFPKTEHGNLDLVYFTTTNPLGPITMIEIPLAKTDLPITTANTYIYLPASYRVLNTFGAEGGSELPAPETTILFIIILFLLSAAVKQNKKFITGYIVFSIGLFTFNLGLFTLLVGLTLAAIARKNLPAGFNLRWVLAGAALLVAVFMLLIVPILIWQMGVFSMGSSQVTRMEGNYATVDEATAPGAPKGLQIIGEDSEGAITVPTRTGVYPVKLELPKTGKTITVRNHLVTKEKQISLTVLLIADWFKYLLYVISLIAGYLTYREYKMEEKIE
ncbi:MAG: hypothetical protein B6U97_00550 [Candidatus Altiarchaeales archaeon ex4484_96]|nr:MAG: hypothetical protein B6U97_00550 [Candidatus Altiarchaeales archaeon ex4484_96]